MAPKLIEFYVATAPFIEAFTLRMSCQILRIIFDLWSLVANTHPMDLPGTHWVCFKSGSPFIYFDPYGISPPTDIMEVIPKKLYYNTSQIQDLDSTACGWFCIALILSDKNKKKPTKMLMDFLGRFTMNTKNNDKKLYLILKDLGVDV